MFGRRRGPLSDVDPASVTPRHRAEVEGALDAATRYESIVERAPAGPVRDRLEQLRADVHAAVRSVRDAAAATDRRVATLGDLHPDAVTRQLKDVRRELARAEEDGRDTDTLRQMAESLDRQLGSVHAVWDAVEQAEAELHRLRLRLGEVVALAGVLAAEVAVTPAGPDRLDEVATDLRLLREALDDLSTA